MNSKTVTYEQVLQAALPTYIKYRTMSDSRDQFGEARTKQKAEAQNSLIEHLLDQTYTLSNFIDRLFGVDDTWTKLKELYDEC